MWEDHKFTWEQKGV